MDRRVVLAIVLMMVIAIIPATFMAPPAPPPVVDSLPATPPPPPPAPAGGAAPGGAVSARLRGDTVRVSSALYRYGISTRGGALVEAHMRRYRSLAEGDTADVQLFPDDGTFLRLAVAAGRDTIPLHQFALRPSARALTVEGV